MPRDCVGRARVPPCHLIPNFHLIFFLLLQGFISFPLWRLYVCIFQLKLRVPAPSILATCLKLFDRVFPCISPSLCPSLPSQSSDNSSDVADLVSRLLHDAFRFFRCQARPFVNCTISCNLNFEGSPCCARSGEWSGGSLLRPSSICFLTRIVLLVILSTD